MQIGTVSRTPILREILRTHNLLTLCVFEKSYIFFQQVGCVRSKPQVHTVQKNPKSSLWTQDWDQTGFPLLFCGIWLFYSLETRLSTSLPWSESRARAISRNVPCFEWCRRCSPSNVQFSHQEAFVYVFEDNEAVIKMIIKRRSPTMRHVSRTHRVALDWLFDRITLDPKIEINYIDTKKQLTRMLTKGNFARDEWNLLLCLFNISRVSFTDCSEVMTKRTREESGEERQSRDRWWVWLQGFPQLRHLLHQKARGREGTKVKVLCVCKLRNMIEREPVVGRDTSHAPGNHKRVVESTHSAKLGLLKSGKLMNWWMIERGNHCLPSKRSKSTAIRYWGRRNRIRFVVRIQIIFGQGEW